MKIDDALEDAGYHIEQLEFSDGKLIGPDRPAG